MNLETHVRSEPRCILVVDDEEGLRMTLAANLELDGFEVFEAGSGEDALALARERRFDLVISDIQMPGIDGTELFRRLREVSPGTPVVLMTGFALEELVRGAMEQGVYTVLAKPFEVSHALKVASTAAALPVVLVVDDAPAVSTSLTQALESCGLRTRAAPDAEAAERIVRSENVDICVIDMLLQETSGPEVVDRLREISPQLAVIGMSGEDVPELVRRVAAQGMHTFLKKPFRVQDLLREIAHARGRRGGKA